MCGSRGEDSTILIWWWKMDFRMVGERDKGGCTSEAYSKEALRPSGKPPHVLRQESNALAKNLARMGSSFSERGMGPFR